MTRPQRRPRSLDQLTPEAAAVVRAMSSSPLSRRGLLAGAGALGAGAFLAGCGTGGTSTGGSTAGPTAAADRSDEEKIVNWANWTAYLDYDEATKTYPTLEKFQQQTGIKATYAEDIEDNDTYYGKIQGQLRNGQDIGKDVIVFTDWMAGRVIRQNYVQRLDKANLPNADNLLEQLKTVSFDDGRNYSLTWQSGYAGLAWDKALLKEATGKDRLENVSDLWQPGLKGRISVLSEFRDTLGLIMMEQGVDISGDFSSEQFDAALAVFTEQLNSGQIRSVKGNSYLEELKAGDAIAVIGWSGDILAANFEAEADKYEFALPSTGGTLWSDNMLVPIGSPHKKNAETLMNYYYDPKVAAEVAAYVNFICPVEGAKEEIGAFDASLADSPYIFPTEADLAKVKGFRNLTASEDTDYSGRFQAALGN